MHFKLIIAFVSDETTDDVMKAARDAGATGATVINHARGEGLDSTKTFFGMTMTIQRDVLLFLVEEHLCRHILETIAEVGNFEKSKAGIAFQIDVEDAVGVSHQISELTAAVEEQI